MDYVGFVECFIVVIYFCVGIVIVVGSIVCGEWIVISDIDFLFIDDCLFEGVFMFSEVVMYDFEGWIFEVFVYMMDGFVEWVG